jgi:hypothetical protein
VALSSSKFATQFAITNWPTVTDIDPGWLLNVVTAKLQIPDETALVPRLQVTQTIIRMIREAKLAVSPMMMMRRVRATSGLSVIELLALARKKGGA